MEITTEICKAQLIKDFPTTSEKDWKRISKFKDNDGNWCREFGNTKHNLNVFLKEDKNSPTGVVLLPSNPNTQTNTPPKQTVPNDPIMVQKFLAVIKDGIDWNQLEGQRSSYDFGEILDFNPLVANNHNLLKDYFDHIYNQFGIFDAVDEGDAIYHLINKDFDDSLPDLMVILEKISQAYQSQGLAIKINDLKVDNYLSILEVIRENITDMAEEGEDPDAKKALKNIKAFYKILDQYAPSSKLKM